MVTAAAEDMVDTGVVAVKVETAEVSAVAEVAIVEVVSVVDEEAVVAVVEVEMITAGGFQFHMLVILIFGNTVFSTIFLGFHVNLWVA